MQKVYKLFKVQYLLEYLAHEMNPRTISMSSTEPVNTRIYIKIAQPIRNRANLYIDIHRLTDPSQNPILIKPDLSSGWN